MTTPEGLRFSTHDFALFCYAATNINVIYAGRPHTLYEAGKTAPTRTAAHDTRYPNAKFGAYRAFESLVHAEWNALDGTRLITDVDLDQVFPDHLILHGADPARLVRPDPVIGDEPTLVVEINDRSLSIYMDVFLQMLPDNPAEPLGERIRYRTLAHTRLL